MEEMWKKPARVTIEGAETDEKIDADETDEKVTGEHGEAVEGDKTSHFNHCNCHRCNSCRCSHGCNCCAT